MKTFDNFFRDLLPTVPGCPEPVAEHALLRASQRFCELTRAWVRTMEPIFLSNTNDTFDLELEPNSELVRIEWAKMNDREVAIARPGQDMGRTSTYIACDDGTTVFVNPKPAEDGLLVLRVALKPSNSATGVEDFVYARHAEVIALGARALLKQHPRKTYSAGDGPVDWTTFEDRCSSIRTDLWRGLARNTPRTRPQFF